MSGRMNWRGGGFPKLEYRGELGRVTAFETRYEYIPIRSSANVLLAKVSKAVTHPISGDIIGKRLVNWTLNETGNIRY